MDNEPLFSNSFSEYQDLSPYSKRLLNGCRVAFASSCLTLAGIGAGSTPNAFKNTPEIALSSTAGFIGSVVATALLARALNNSSEQDRMQHSQTQTIDLENL